MSSETLWDRVNDAINTIIRRDESTETGELLPPCVEGTIDFFLGYFWIHAYYYYVFMLLVFLFFFFSYTR